MHCLLKPYFLFLILSLDSADSGGNLQNDMPAENRTLALLRIKIRNETGDNAADDDEKPMIIRLRIRNETDLPEKSQVPSNDTVIRIKIINETNGEGIASQDYDGSVQGWSAWGPWSSCTKKCGGGQQFQIRTCTLPVCEGSTSRMQICNSHPCLERLYNCTKQCSGDTDCGEYSKCCTSDGCNTVCVTGSVCRFDTRSPCAQTICRKGFECIGWTPSNCGLSLCATIPKCVCPITCPSGFYKMDPQTGLQLCECAPPCEYSSCVSGQRCIALDRLCNSCPPVGLCLAENSMLLQIHDKIVRDGEDAPFSAQSPEIANLVSPISAPIIYAAVPPPAPSFGSPLQQLVSQPVLQVPPMVTSGDSVSIQQPLPTRIDSSPALTYNPFPPPNFVSPIQQPLPLGRQNLTVARLPSSQPIMAPSYDPAAMLFYRQENEVDYDDYDEAHK